MTLLSRYLPFLERTEEAAKYVSAATAPNKYGCAECSNIVAVGAKKVSRANSYKHDAAATASTTIPIVATALEERPIGAVYAGIFAEFTGTSEKIPFLGRAVAFS